MSTEVLRIGEHGTLAIPADMRRRLGLDEGSLVLVEECGASLQVSPAGDLPVEMYSNERKAEFLLNNAVDEEDYRRALADVRALGLDPDQIPHTPPQKA